ncbi:hypothetical protein DFH29DRAFT_1071586 [Suillus ampliporus]|nr:hypothetical protein DFH29DRAFT_1071586 [Suillus ampliporus]
MSANEYVLGDMCNVQLECALRVYYDATYSNSPVLIFQQVSHCRSTSQHTAAPIAAHRSTPQIRKYGAASIFRIFNCQPSATAAAPQHRHAPSVSPAPIPPSSMERLYPPAGSTSTPTSFQSHPSSYVVINFNIPSSDLVRSSGAHASRFETVQPDVSLPSNVVATHPHPKKSGIGSGRETVAVTKNSAAPVPEPRPKCLPKDSRTQSKGPGTQKRLQEIPLSQDKAPAAHVKSHQGRKPDMGTSFLVVIACHDLESDGKQDHKGDLRREGRWYRLRLEMATSDCARVRTVVPGHVVSRLVNWLAFQPPQVTRLPESTVSQIIIVVVS